MEEKYIEQITRDGYELYPNTKLVKYLRKELTKQGIVLA